jgi:uncharacterized protein YcaQ
MKVSLSTAQRLALHRQGLDGQWDLPAGKEGVAQTVERLGYVQIDTIAVVRRAHHHTFWARLPEYEPQMLHEIQAQDRRVFEWWAPAMSYVPMSDYRYYATRMGPENIRRWKREWYAENKEVVEGVLARIRQEGPLGSRDFKAPEGYKRGTWWSWKPAKEALEVLFDMGELMVSERRNFQRIYDLRERVLPTSLDMSEPSPDEIGRFRVRRTLGGLGFSPVDGIHWGRRWGPAATPEAVQELIDAGEVTSFEIEGLEGTFCALTETLDVVSGQPGDNGQVHILSPFDNLVIRRGWVSQFFGFEYKLEAYTPAAKRKYGYFCLPILWGTRFVGRMDAKADRKAKTFIVRKVIFEPGFGDYEGLWSGLVQKLGALSVFSGCEQIAVEQTDPEMVKEPFERALGSIQ